MTSRNADAVSNAQGEFHAAKPRDEPLTSHGHQPGVLVGNDTVPEFSAQTLPPGSAPSDRTFTPNPDTTTGRLAPQTIDGSAADEIMYPSASDTLGGATSADVHTGLGKPAQGQTSTEMRHEGQHLRKTQGAGLVGVGASAAPSGNQHVDEALQPAQRALERDEGDRAGTRGDKLDAGAEHLPNERFDNP